MLSRLPYFFAQKYLYSRKSHSVVNLIAGLSAVTVAIPVAAMIVLLSVYNGLEGMLKSMYGNFDPPLQITAAEGKVFSGSNFDPEKLLSIEGVSYLTQVLEENALFVYGEKQHIGVLRGVDTFYSRVIPLDSVIVRGDFELKHGDLNQAVLGLGVAYSLGIGLNLNQPLEIIVPRRQTVSSLLPLDLAKSARIFPAGIFALESEIDGQYVIAPLDFAQQLLDYPQQISWIGLELTPEASVTAVQKAVRKALGEDFIVKDRFQQKETLYTIMKYEKYGIYFILLLVVIIASFSLIGSLVMLIIDKRKDIFTLTTFGTGITLIRKIFTTEGLLISLWGVAGGLVLGITVTLLQQQLGIVKIAGESFLIDAYPVSLQAVDVVLVAVSVLAIDLLISWLTVRNLITEKEQLR